jgi:hypothetical protein
LHSILYYLVPQHWGLLLESSAEHAVLKATNCLRPVSSWPHHLSIRGASCVEESGDYTAPTGADTMGAENW